MIDTAKHGLDAASIVTAFIAFFHWLAIPGVATALSSVWLLTRLYDWVKEREFYKCFIARIKHLLHKDNTL